MPGNRLWSSSIAPPTVAAPTSISSSLLVNFRSGVGILTLVVINQNAFSSTHRRLSLRRQQALEFPQARLDFARMTAVSGDGVERFQAITRDTQHERIFCGNLAAGNEFLGNANRHPAGGFGEDAFALG